MSTYEELMVILTVGLLIVAILNLKNKKIAVLFFGENDSYFLTKFAFAGSGDWHSPSGSLVKYIISEWTDICQ